MYSYITEKENVDIFLGYQLTMKFKDNKVIKHLGKTIVIDGRTKFKR